MSPLELLNQSEERLKAFAVSRPTDELQRVFDSIWEAIRGSGLYAGQPRSTESIESLALARIAQQLATYSGHDRLLIESWRMVGYSLVANEQYEEAVPYYSRAIEQLDRIGEHREAARSRIGYVAALYQAGRYPEALEAAATAERWFTENNDEHAYGRLCTNIANLYHRVDNHSEAYKYYLKARAAFQKVGNQGDFARSCLNLGNVLSNIDRFEESDRMYEESEKLAQEAHLTELWAQAKYNRAYLYYLRGRYSDALQSFSRLREHFKRSGSDRHYALCDLDEAEIYLQLNLSRDAATLATRAAKLFKTLGLTYEEAKATAFSGVALLQMRRFAEALEAFGVAQKMFEQEGNLYWIGLLDLYRAEVHLSLKRLWEAYALATQAKKIFDQLAIPSKRILSLALLGRVALTLNDVKAAEAATWEISGIIRETKSPLLLFPFYELSAEIAERAGRPDEAERHYALAAQDLESHQARLHHDELRVTFFKGRHQAYDALIRLSLNKSDSSEALAAAYAWCERAKSRGLIELLSHHLPSVQTHAEPSLLAKINRLREELNIQYARSQPEARPLPSSPNFETIAIKENELARTLREVSVADPEYVSLQQVSIATLDAVRAMLPERTTLVEYFSTQDEILAFIVSHTDARVARRLCPGSRVFQLQERLGFQLEKFMLGDEYIKAHEHLMLESARRHLQELYKNLLAPFAGELQTPHVTIVPHGALHFLPFHAFYDGEKYLIDRFEISYAPSASVLKYCLEKTDIRNAAPSLVGVADENTPFVAEEITALSRLFTKARILSDEQATRAAFAAGASSSSFLHIATHVTFRQDNPMFSSFKLADGWLTALDLFSMSCQTNLVTLSGCKSGMSEVAGSDDLVGLMRGFMYAGARALLLSLWNVNDKSTSELMTHFYREWQQGATKSKALQTAMSAVRERYPNPFYWAPFLLIGKA